MANRLPRHKIRPRHLSVCTLVDNWSSRADLRPCQAVVQEDLATRVGKSTASIIDGKSISKQIRQEIAEEIREMKHKRSKVPELAFILVGNRKDSEIYVNLKRKACEELGIRSSLVHLSEEIREQELVQHIQRLNLNSDVHGVLVQLPLPLHISEDKVVSAINIEKDVDGLHPMNLGRLAVQKSEPLFLPCASRGCIEFLLRTGVQIRAKHVIVIGCCTLIGKPTALLLHRYDATVTVVHSFTPNPADITRKGDIVIAAAGVPHLVRGSWLKPGAVVLDMSSNQIVDPASHTGYRVVGDVCYKGGSQKWAYNLCACTFRGFFKVVGVRIRLPKIRVLSTIFRRPTRRGVEVELRLPTVYQGPRSGELPQCRLISGIVGVPSCSKSIELSLVISGAADSRV